MPFVTITLLEGKDKDYIKGVSEGINSAVKETMDFPDDDLLFLCNFLRRACCL